MFDKGVWGCGYALICVNLVALQWHNPIEFAYVMLS